MVVTTRQSDSLFSRGRILDEDKITKALNHATDLGAEYAEIRLVSETTNTASLKDGKLEEQSQVKKLELQCAFLQMAHGVSILQAI